MCLVYETGVRYVSQEKDQMRTQRPEQGLRPVYAAQDEMRLQLEEVEEGVSQEVPSQQPRSMLYYTLRGCRH